MPRAIVPRRQTAFRVLNAETQRAESLQAARRRRRIKVVAAAIVVGGLTAALAVYWIGTHRTEPTLEDLLPGSRALTLRQIRLLYGLGVQMAYEYIQDLKHPAVEAVLIVLASTLAAIVYVRASNAPREDDPSNYRTIDPSNYRPIELSADRSIDSAKPRTTDRSIRLIDR